MVDEEIANSGLVQQRHCTLRPARPDPRSELRLQVVRFLYQRAIGLGKTTCRTGRLSVSVASGGDQASREQHASNERNMSKSHKTTIVWTRNAAVQSREVSLERARSLTAGRATRQAAMAALSIAPATCDG